MELVDSNIIIEQTKRWIQNVVIGCNFCPFASRPFNENRIHYSVSYATAKAEALKQVMLEMYKLDEDEHVETTLLIFANGFISFDEYLDLADLAELLVADQGYEGIYQVASFHPSYLFAGSDLNDPANYTNRSLYPMLHFLREESVENVLERYEEPEKIPEKNIAFANQKGLVFMQQLRQSCM